MHKRGLCRHAVCVCVCVSVCMSVTFVNSVKRNKHHHQIFFTILVFPCQTALQYSYSDDDLPLMGASNAGGVGRNCDSEPSVCCYRCNRQVLSPVDHGHRLASCDTSLVVSGGVDCRRRRRNVYDKKPQRYAKDNRTAHLTTCSDKSVAYVTNNKRLCRASLDNESVMEEVFT